MDQGLEYTGGYAPWGNDPDQISVNIFNQQPFFGPYHSPFYAGFYEPFWGPYSYGFHPNRWGYGFYNPWRWNGGFGFGFGPWGFANNFYSTYWNRSFWHGGFYGGYYSNPYHYGHRNVAYNTGRRNSYSDLNSYRGNSRSRASRIQGYTNPRELRAGRSNYDTRTYRTQSERVRSRSNPQQRSSFYSRSSRSSRSGDVRAIQNTRSRSNYSTQMRRSRSSSNSSGTYRSSSSSTRSSGTRSSSSSRSSRGRGN